ncbi:hypothetical protein H0R92_09005 [Treponema sp. OMZ 840]|uniref:hypothetical protein n=1 Tax=Treponema sp. OMZ 840 TaxID=244313 RepID=UPI003D8A8BE5
MKKIIPAVLVLSALFFSCNQAVKNEYATVLVDLDGSSSGARAIDQNGLPFLKDTRITIETNGRLSGYFVKELKAAEPKNAVLHFPVGDTIHMCVKAFNESGIWSGSTTFTVEEGSNAVSVKLNKTISGAQALSFSISKFHDALGMPSARLDLYSGNKKIDSKDKILAPPSFCRDAKGRIFVTYFYANGGRNVLDLVRYDSEGNNPKRLIPGEQGNSVWLLTSDLTTGKVYVLNYNKNLYEVGEEELETYPSSNWPFVDMGVLYNFDLIHCIAAHGGQLFVLGTKTGETDTELYVYDIENFAVPPSFQLNNEADNDIDDPPSGSTYTDMFVTDGAVYLLRSDYADDPDSDVYSKGALIRYDYDKDNKEIDDKKEFGTSGEDADEEPHIVLTPDTSFYGPLKFIGFDDDVLYIADDGVIFTYSNEVLYVTANKNRIASFNTATESLSFTDTSVTWEKEML